MKSTIVYKELSYTIVGLCFKVQNELGRFCKEKQYCERLEGLLRENNITYKREYTINGNNIHSPQGNRVDFIIENKIVVEIKAKQFIFKDEYYQTQRYLHGANLELGLLINFRNKFLSPKRILNADYSGHSDDIRGLGSRTQGYSLVELLVALGLLALLGIGFANIWKTGLRVSQRTHIASDLGRVLDQRMETLRSLSDSTLRTMQENKTETLPYGTAQLLLTQSIHAVDDPADGVAPIDTDPVDYFRATLTAQINDTTMQEKRTSDITPFP